MEPRHFWWLVNDMVEQAESGGAKRSINIPPDLKQTILEKLREQRAQKG